MRENGTEYLALCPATCEYPLSGDCGPRDIFYFLCFPSFLLISPWSLPALHLPLSFALAPSRFLLTLPPPTSLSRLPLCPLFSCFCSCHDPYLSSSSQPVLSQLCILCPSIFLVFITNGKLSLYHTDQRLKMVTGPWIKESQQ